MFATRLWLAATGVSTFMVWTATSIVAADVTDRPAPVVNREDVVSELQAGPSSAQAPPTSAPRAAGPTSTTRPPGPAPSTQNPALPQTPPAQPRQPGAPVAPTPAPNTPPTVAGPPPTARPTTPTTTAPAPPTATYSTSGGVVRVACNGFFISLISAIPSNGYSANVVARGPAKVEVHFVRPGDDQPIWAACFGEPIRYDERDWQARGRP
jgi:hypothetical protein